MRRISSLLLIYYLIIACQSPSSGTVKNGPSGLVSNREPFDRQGQLIYTRHALCRMDCRHITPKEIHEILDRGTINYMKSEPEARPDPKYAMEGYTDEQQHLRIIIAP